MIFVTHHNSPKVLQPRKKSLNLPTPLVAAKFSTVLCLCSLTISFVRRNHFDSELFQLLVQRIRVIRLVADHPLRSLVGEAFADGSPDKFDFVRRSTCRVNSERKTSAVCRCRQLRTFAPTGFSHRKAPFLAEANAPSMKVSDKSSFPQVCKSSAKITNTHLSLPSRTHCWKRRWQVWYGGKRSGKSCQRAPLRKIHSTPFITSRSERRGLPRVAIIGGLSNDALIKAHCSSVNSSRRAIREVYQTIFEMASNKIGSSE